MTICMWVTKDSKKMNEKEDDKFQRTLREHAGTISREETKTDKRSLFRKKESYFASIMFPTRDDALNAKSKLERLGYQIQTIFPVQQEIVSKKK